MHSLKSVMCMVIVRLCRGIFVVPFPMYRFICDSCISMAFCMRGVELHFFFRRYRLSCANRLENGCSTYRYRTIFFWLSHTFAYAPECNYIIFMTVFTHIQLMERSCYVFVLKLRFYVHAHALNIHDIFGPIFSFRIECACHRHAIE
jgi:hypothetical protein